MTYKELGEKVAEQALDYYLINGKTMREWINILSDNMSVLDKIRAEIEDCKQYQFETYGIQRYFKINDIWQIIDKYK